MTYPVFTGGYFPDAEKIVEPVPDNLLSDSRKWHITTSVYSEATRRCLPEDTYVHSILDFDFGAAAMWY
jgi:hypothetical protein